MQLFAEQDQRFPAFDLPVQAPGYRWWYIDAASDDHRQAMTLIAFRGSVFSPYYRWARARGSAIADNHVAINVALYGHDRQRWSMTERGQQSLQCSPHCLQIGPSQLRHEGDDLIIDIDERCAPLPYALRGQMRIRLGPQQAQQFALDPRGRHRWWPVSPQSRIQVSMEQPHMHWEGSAYVDSNAGSEPLEHAFRHWDWCRTIGAGPATILYNCKLLDGSDSRMTLMIDGEGQVHRQQATSATQLPGTFWKLNRSTGSEDGRSEVLRTLESAPFYARSMISTTLQGRRQKAIHENLDLRRLVKTSTQLMLPFRMPRNP